MLSSQDHTVRSKVWCTPLHYTWTTDPEGESDFRNRLTQAGGSVSGELSGSLLPGLPHNTGPQLFRKCFLNLHGHLNYLQPCESASSVSEELRIFISSDLPGDANAVGSWAPF